MSNSNVNRQDVYLEVVSVNFSGWATARVISNSSHIPVAKRGDYVSIHKRHGLEKGEKLYSKVTRNEREGKAKWFAVACERQSLVKWEPWQDGKDSLAITLPSTAPGSAHNGIHLGCWKCGEDVVVSDEIFRIKNTAIWTTTIDASHLIVDTESSFNKFKKCYVRSVKCICGNSLGSYYESRYHDSPENQSFPCFKLTTAWETKTWFGGKPKMATVLLGEKQEVKDCIAKLKISEEWELDQHLQGGGRVDQHTYHLMEQARIAMRATEEAEKRAKEAEERIEEAEERARERISAHQTTEPHVSDRRVVWECHVDGNWIPYPSDLNDLIETQCSKRGTASYNLHGKKYKIDFSEYPTLQINLQTDYERHVRRNPMLVWECDIDGKWIQYPRDICNLLEEHFRGQTKARFKLKNNDFQYEVDFQKGKLQVNLQTKAERDIRRRLPMKTDITPSNELPENWISHGIGDECMVVPISESSTEWNFVEDKLTTDIPSAKLVRVERVENTHLWDYFNFRAKRANSLSGSSNIERVWHGTRTVDPMAICSDQADGFMMQHIRKGMWGRGIYFASNASYSNSFAHISESHSNKNNNSNSRINNQRRLLYAAVNGSQKHRSLILTKLVVGEEIALPPDSSLRVCPDKDDGSGRYDTVTGVVDGSKIYIVYENGRAYPEYLVTYATL
eukprot:jgi/Psemu1/282222/fgenesh1_pg.4_\